LLFINISQFVQEKLVLKFQRNMSLVSVLELLKDFFEVELVKLFDLGLIVQLCIVVDAVKAIHELTGLSLRNFGASCGSWSRIGLF
jgi:hypothetical protein